MQNFKVFLCYDGTNYHGWAIQKDVVTIQGIIEEKLKTLFNKKITITGCSRTDAFVHAYKNCFNFKVDTKLDEQKILNALNALLPSDIRVLSVEKVNNNFNSQYFAKSKIYKYVIMNDKDKESFLNNNYALIFNRKINIRKIKKASKVFCGEHDFLSFSISELSDTVRKILWIKIKKQKNIIEIYICGNGFLRAMNRMVVGCLLDINDDKKTIGDLESLLKNPHKGSAITKARACGLYLVDINY